MEVKTYVGKSSLLEEAPTISTAAEQDKDNKDATATVFWTATASASA